MRRYESVIILSPDLSDDDIRNQSDRFSQIVREHGGEIIKIEDWGPRRLAYLVKKRDRGRYVLLDYVGLPALLNEMERQFKISEEVLKYLSVMVDENVDLEAFKAQAEPPAEEPAEDASAEPAPESAPETPAETAQPDAAPASEAPAEEKAEPAKAEDTPAEPAPEPTPAEPATEPTTAEPTPEPAPEAPAEAAQPDAEPASEAPVEEKAEPAKAEEAPAAQPEKEGQ